MQKYLVVIEKAQNNYSAFSPDVPGCIATGETIEETLLNMKEALEFHIEALEEVPQSHNLIYHFQNGIFNEKEIAEDYLITFVEIPLAQMA